MLFCLLISCDFFSQDTIYKRNGDIINAKVLEVDLNLIKFKKTSNPDGPLFSISKSQVTLIQYKNGSKDVFPLEKSPNVKSKSVNKDEIIYEEHNIGVDIEI